MLETKNINRKNIVFSNDLGNLEIEHFGLNYGRG